MTRKTKLFKQFSIGCLTILLSGSLNTLAVFADVAQANDGLNQSSVALDSNIAEQNTSADKIHPEKVTVPEVDDANQARSAQDEISQEKSTSTPQVPETSESEIATSPKVDSQVTPEVMASQESSVSALSGANPDEGTKGLEYNDDYTQVTGYTGESKDIVIPEGVTRIGDKTFYRKGIKSAVLPKSLTIIGNEAFSENDLTEISLPNLVTIMGDYAFSANKLTSIAIPNGVTRLGIGLCISNKLTSLKLPESLTVIDDRAFQFNNLTSVILPKGLTSIGLDAFVTNDLETVVFPESLTTIKEGAFQGNQLTTITIPKSVTSIGKNAFGFNKLTTVTIDNAATSIGDHAFDWNQLTTVSLGDSVTSIGDYAFILNKLTTITIPDSVTSIGSSAFQENHIRSLSIPDTVTELGYNIAQSQKSTITLARRASYTQSDLGISTHYKTDMPVTLTSDTEGVTVDGTTVHLSPRFTGDKFVVKWAAWNEQHTGTLTVQLVTDVKGKITYLDSDTGHELLPAKDTSSKVGGKFGWTTPEPITGYTVDLSQSQIVTKSDEVPQIFSLRYMMLLTQTKTLEELINFLNQQPIGLTTTSVEISYVYTKSPNNTGQVTVKYVDTDGHAIAKDKVLTGSIGDDYQTEQLAIEGYKFKTINGKSTGKYDKMPQTVTYVYTKNVVNTAQVTVKYVDTDGQTIAKDKVLIGSIGDDYQTEQLAITGYTFHSITGESVGKYTKVAKTVTYVYTKNDDKIPDNKTPDNKTPDNNTPDNNTPDNKTPDNANGTSNTSNNKIPDNTKSDHKLSGSKKIKVMTAKQLPVTGESQKTNLAAIVSGVVMLLLALSLVGLRLKHKQSTK